MVEACLLGFKNGVDTPAKKPEQYDPLLPTCPDVILCPYPPNSGDQDAPARTKRVAAPCTQEKTWEALYQLGGVDHPSHIADEGSIGTQHLQTETKMPIWSAKDGLAGSLFL